MQVTTKNISPTKVKLSIVADTGQLTSIKEHTLNHFRSKVKIAGFREGKAPLHVVEKHVDQTQLQSEFLDEALNLLYRQATKKEALKVFGQPSVNLTKFVPFTNLEFDAEVEILGKVKLADYKKIKKSLKEVKLEPKQVDEVLESLATRSAEKIPKKRACKNGDEVIIDFKGVNEKGEPINGAEGKDYPLMLGSNSFIPGFEDNLVGLKTGEEKTFTLKFPKDYGVKALASQKVTFTVTIKVINELERPKIDDEFAKTLGQFDSLKSAKVDIEKQLLLEKQAQADRQLENELILEIVDKSSLDLPESLVDEQLERLRQEVRQNLAYKGQTWQEMLEQEGKTEDEFVKSDLTPEAERRVKTGLILAEISNIEKIDLDPEEIDNKMMMLSAQYTDKAMKEELAKPEARQEIASRLLTEKTIVRLVEIATSTKN